MAYSWLDKVVLITGAASGIGAHIARNLMNEGVKHVAVLDINEAAGLELQAELNSKYGSNKVKFYLCDVTNDDQLLGIFDAVVKEQGYLDVVINNAGIMNDGLHAYKKEIQINVTAVVTGTLKAMEVMSKDKDGKGGTVINVSSVTALHQSYIFPIYFATKSAILQFSNCIGKNEYYSRTGVRVITMCFGATDTEILNPANIGNFNEYVEKLYPEVIKSSSIQKVDNAVQGLIDAFKVAESGSTWLSNSDRPVKDITATVQKAYGILYEPVFE